MEQRRQMSQVMTLELLVPSCVTLDILLSLSSVLVYTLWLMIAWKLNEPIM